MRGAAESKAQHFSTLGSPRRKTPAPAGLPWRGVGEGLIRAMTCGG